MNKDSMFKYCTCTLYIICSHDGSPCAVLRKPLGRALSLGWCDESVHASRAPYWWVWPVVDWAWLATPTSCGVE